MLNNIDKAVATCNSLKYLRKVLGPLRSHIVRRSWAEGFNKRDQHVLRDFGPNRATHISHASAQTRSRSRHDEKIQVPFFKVKSVRRRSKLHSQNLRHSESDCDSVASLLIIASR